MATSSPAWVWLRRTYRRMFEREEDARTREVADALHRVPLFRSLPRAVLRDLADIMHTRTYRRDEIVYYEGDPGLGLYIVQDGRVRLSTQDETSAPHELRQAGPSEAFGELSLLGDFPRMETAQALQDTRLLGLFRPDLKNITRQNPKVGALLFRTLAQRTAAQQAALIELVAGTEGRVHALRLLDSAMHDPAMPPSAPAL